LQTSNSILTTSIEYLKGIGPQKGALLRKELNIHTYQDLLYHYPFRYYDRTQILKINQINAQSETVQFIGKVDDFYEEGEGRKKRLIVTVKDTTGSIELIWFQGINYIKKELEHGKLLLIFGKISNFNGHLNLAHPEIEYFNEQSLNAGLQPVYPSTENLKFRGLNNKSIAKTTSNLFDKINARDIVENLPIAICKNYNLCSRYEALKWIHFPENMTQLNAARRRIKWEELFVSQLKIARVKAFNDATKGYTFEKVGTIFNTFYKSFIPFELTNAQKRVLKEIRQDTTTGFQMNRLVQGDVGSGKTMVAILSMLLAIDNNFQSCMMAPTEILAKQHFESIKNVVGDLPIKVALLTGSTKIKERRQLLQELLEGTIHILIGTHALIEDTVQFKNLGLAIIDEQHRFGVDQRSKLWNKNKLAPHVLVMTATPIPRTLAMTVYGDLNNSIIDELPPGRKEIKTIYRNEQYRAKIMDFIRSEIDKGRQAYIVYPLIEENEKLAYESLTKGYEQVKVFFPDHKYKIAMVHGKQENELKERNMRRFIDGEANILVATTVIEVGVNVPNASVMLIESSERFGLSQLHQLRGRVGRGAEQSYCILLGSHTQSNESKRRMDIMCSTNDGFKIAEEDMQMRGPGDLYGTKQSGILKFRLADILVDKDILEETRIEALKVLKEDPDIQNPQNEALRMLLKEQDYQSHWSKIS
jgi:ATP-dependent DNA helicase RecG